MGFKRTGFGENFCFAIRLVLFFDICDFCQLVDIVGKRGCGVLIFALFINRMGDTFKSITISELSQIKD